MPDAPPLEAATATGAGGSTLASGTVAVLAICGGRGGAGGVDTVGVATTGLGMRDADVTGAGLSGVAGGVDTVGVATTGLGIRDDGDTG